MQAKLNPYRAAPELMKAMGALDAQVSASGLEPSLVHLVKTRASIINGCSFCVHMHTSEARRDGETEERLYLLGAWRESSLYTKRERAALAWTDALTLIADTHAPDPAFEQAREVFDEEEMAKLTVLVAVINGWNRIAIGFRSQHPVHASHKAA